jgi:predicted ATPase/DNA-binding NarL/FixJ family response regulator
MQVPFADPLLFLELQNTVLPLVGREMEMQMVAALLETVEQDRPVGARALMVTGEPGVGKSRLLAEMYQMAREQGFTILETQTYETGSMFPYLSFIDALRPVIRTYSPEQLRRYTGLANAESEAVSSNISLTGLPLITSLTKLFPELAHRLSLVVLPQELLSPDQEKFRLFDSIATLLEHMAMERPVLLSIDNMQWADSASRELTMYLTVRLHRSRVALVGATRPMTMLADQEETGGSPNAVAEVMKILNKLISRGLLLFLPLGSLSEEAAKQHIHSLLLHGLPDGVIDSLLSRAEGNLYFLEELVRTLIQRGELVFRNGVWQARKSLSHGTLPRSITLAVEERLQGLNCRELLQVAALFGRTFPQTPLMQVLREEPEHMQLLLTEALQQNLIARVSHEDELQDEREEDIITDSAQESSFVFCQGIVQEVLRAEVPKQRAVLLHDAIGSALEAYYGPTVLAHAADLARHYVQGSKKSEALYWSLQAGEEATRQQAHREAINHLRAVLRLLEAGTQPAFLDRRVSLTQIAIALGESWLKLGELNLAVDAFRLALEKHREASEEEREHIPLLLAKANRLLGDVYRIQGKYELALAHSQAASSLLDNDEESGSPQEAENIASQLPSWLAYSYEMLSRSTDPTNLSSVASLSLNVTERLLLLQTKVTLDLLLFQPEKAETGLWKACQLATDIGDRGGQAFALYFLGWLRGWGEHISEAVRFIAQARDLYIATGDPFHTVLCDQSLGIIYQARGEMEKARFHNFHGFEQAQRYGVQQILGWLRCNQGIMALAQGDWEECELHLQSALQDAEEDNNNRLKALAAQAQAMLHARRGKWVEAEDIFQIALQAAVNTEWYSSTLALYGHFLAVTGRERAALVQLERVAREPEGMGYFGHFYIPFLAEAHLHLQKNQRATAYIEQIRHLRSFCYYGVSVDRILGEVAAQQGDWQMAERAFEEGLLLCRHSHNKPEEAAILYEQARTALMRSRVESPSELDSAVSRIHDLCQQARSLFSAYGMQRAVDLVDTLQEGVDQIKTSQTREVPTPIAPTHLAHTGYQLELHLTKRELEVLRLVAEGQTDREVADALVLSPRTVNRHLSNIFTKLDVPGRAAAVAYAIRQGLVK